MKENKDFVIDRLICELKRNHELLSKFYYEKDFVYRRIRDERIDWLSEEMKFKIFEKILKEDKEKIYDEKYLLEYPIRLIMLLECYLSLSYTLEPMHHRIKLYYKEHYEENE